MLALEDEIRPEAFAAVAALHELGRHVVMNTGDAHQVAESVVRTLGVDEVMAEVLPEDKSTKAAELQGRGLSVAMMGEGVNDAPALARADVGIAIGSGTTSRSSRPASASRRAIRAALRRSSGCRWRATAR